VARFSRWLLTTALAAPSLIPLVPSGSLINCQSVQVCHHYPSFPIGAGKTSERGRCSYISSSYSVRSPFFRFGGGRPLHDASTPIFRISTEDPAANLTTTSAKVCLGASLTFLFMNVFFFPRCSCCFGLRFLMPLLHFCSARCLISNLGPLGLPHTKSSLARPFGCLFSTVGLLCSCPLRRAGTVRRDSRPRRAAKFCREALSPCVRFFGCQRHPTARYRSPYRSFSAPVVSIAASSLGTSFFSATASEFSWLASKSVVSILFNLSPKNNLAVAVSLLLFRNVLPRNGRCLQNHYLAPGLHAAMWWHVNYTESSRRVSVQILSAGTLLILTELFSLTDINKFLEYQMMAKVHKLSNSDY
jgi:hypothetical protein